jgi:uncharacterized protein YbjT (DUF2867 family)
MIPAMRVLIFGATGMVGQGLLRECLADPDISRVVLVGRSRAPVGHAKVEQHLAPDASMLDALRSELTGIDCCFWCLGISVTGLSEAEYRRITVDLAVGAARQLLEWNPAMTFVFVSGTGADSSTKGRVMWARVKGEAENALLAMPFKAVYAVRPAFIQPLHGIRSRTALYRAFYAISGPLLPVLRRLAPGQVTTTERLGRGMIALAKSGAPRSVLEQRDLNALA